MNIREYKENLQNQKERIFTDEKTLQLLIEEMAKHPWEDFYTQLSLISPNPTQLIKEENTYMVIPISKEELKEVEIPLVLQENYQDVLLERLEKMENAKFYENFWNETLPLELYDDIENFGKIKEQLNRIFDLVRLSLVEKTLDESNLSFVDILGYKPSVFLQRQWKKFLQEENVVDYLKDKSVFSKVFSQVNEDHLFVVKELEQEWKKYLVEQAKEEIVQEEAIVEQKEEPSKEAQTTHTNEDVIGSDVFLSENEAKEEYWVVDFNETLEEQIKDYEGQHLTKELLDEIKGLDEKIHLHNAIAGKDAYGTITDEWLGYYKFHFVRIEKGEIKEHLRIDIGDGKEVNQKYFEYLYEQISKENAQTKEEIVQEETIVEQKEEPSKEEAQTAYINVDEKLKLFREIQELKELIKERELDHLYADSFEQAAQITEKIEKLKSELAVKENSHNKIKQSLEENAQSRLSREIDLALDNQIDRYESVKIMDNTSPILKSIGLKDYPILMSQNHIRNCLHKKGENLHWHGLTKEDILSIPKHLENPTIIMNSFTDEKSKIIVTDTVDKDGLPIIISLKADGKGNYQAETLDSNYITSVYGKNNFDHFLQRNIEANHIIFAQKNKIQNLELFTKLQLLRAFSKDFEFDSIIHQNINNIKGFEKTSFKNLDLTNEIPSEKPSLSERENKPKKYGFER